MRPFPKTDAPTFSPCPAIHAESGVQCHFTLEAHPRNHAAMYSAAGKTVFKYWAEGKSGAASAPSSNASTPALIVTAPPYRIVSARNKKMMVVAVILLAVSAIWVLIWLATAQGVL